MKRLVILTVVACVAILCSCGSDNFLRSRCPEVRPLAAKVGFHIFPSYQNDGTLDLYVWSHKPMGDPGYQISGNMFFSPGFDTVRVVLGDVYICGGSSILYPAWKKFTYPTQTNRPHILEFILHFGNSTTVRDRHRITIMEPDSILFEPIKADSTYHREAEEWLGV